MKTLYCDNCNELVHGETMTHCSCKQTYVAPNGCCVRLGHIKVFDESKQEWTTHEVKQ